MKTKKIPVMVTGVGGGGHGEQIIKALRLGENDYEIIGADRSPFSKGLMEVDHPCLLPDAFSPDYAEALLAVCRRYGVKALFHGSEPELRVMSRERKRIREAGIFLPINPPEVIDLCMDKRKTMAFLRENGFPFPRTIAINSKDCLEEVDFFPAVLKPSVGGGGSANTMLAQSREEIRIFGEYLLGIYPEFIVQEYLGTPETEYTVGVLLSMDGELLNSIAVKRTILSAMSNRLKVPNQTGIEKLGAVLAISSGISQGEIGKFPEITSPCEKIAVRLGCRASVNLQCRFVEGKVYVFEINPRFSGTTSLRAMVGYNEPDILISRHLLGKKIAPRFKFGHGFIARGLEERLMEKISFPKATDYLEQ